MNQTNKTAKNTQKNNPIGPGECPQDNVNHPSHYTSGRFEVIDIIEDQLGEAGLINMCLGNVLKYVCRAGKKDPLKTIEDLKKANWYLTRAIETMEQKGIPDGR